MRRPDSFHLPEYLRMLAGILALYVLVIGFGNGSANGAFQTGIVAFLVFSAARLHRDRRFRRFVALVGAVAFVSTVALAFLAPPRIVYGVVGAWLAVLLGVAIASIGSTLLQRGRSDTSTVLGVLCIYLLLALLYTGINQVLAAFQPNYLHGAQAPPTSSDLLYFSVITITTVGYGDLTPACVPARAVAVVEAMTGQLYLVSVVAAVVGLWRAPRFNKPDEQQGPGG